MRSQARSSAQKCFKNSRPASWESAVSDIQGGMREKVYTGFSERQQGKSGKRLQELKHDGRTPTQSLLIWNFCGKQNCTWDYISLSWQAAVLLGSCSWELKQESRRTKKQGYPLLAGQKYSGETGLKCLFPQRHSEDIRVFCKWDRPDLL